MSVLELRMGFHGVFVAKAITRWFDWCVDMCFLPYYLSEISILLGMNARM